MTTNFRNHVPCDFSAWAEANPNLRIRWEQSELYLYDLHFSLGRKVSIKLHSGTRPEGMYVESKFSFLLISSHNNLVPFCQTHSLSVCVGGTEVQGSYHSPLRLDQEKTETRMPGGLRSLPPQSIWGDCNVGGFLVMLLYPNTTWKLQSLKRPWPTTHNEHTEIFYYSSGLKSKNSLMI